LLLAVVLFQFSAYFLAQYLEYENLVALHPVLTRLGFSRYFDVMTQSFAWKQAGGQTGAPLGMWGYAFKALEVAGFTFGGLVLPAVLYRHPYCEACGIYMRRRQVAVIPASVSPKELKKINKQAQSPEEKAVAAAMPAAADEHGLTTLGTLRTLAEGQDVPAFRAALSELAGERKAAGKLPRRLTVTVCGCKRCSAGRLEASLLSGQGKQLKTQKLPESPISPAAVASILNPPKS
jgi:hypothetical protein